MDEVTGHKQVDSEMIAKRVARLKKRQDQINNLKNRLNYLDADDVIGYEYVKIKEKITEINKDMPPSDWVFLERQGQSTYQLTSYSEKLTSIQDEIVKLSIKEANEKNGYEKRQLSRKITRLKEKQRKIVSLIKKLDHLDELQKRTQEPATDPIKGTKSPLPIEQESVYPKEYIGPKRTDPIKRIQPYGSSAYIAEVSSESNPSAPKRYFLVSADSKKRISKNEATAIILEGERRRQKSLGYDPSEKGYISDDPVRESVLDELDAQDERRSIAEKHAREIEERSKVAPKKTRPTASMESIEAEYMASSGEQIPVKTEFTVADTVTKNDPVKNVWAKTRANTVDSVIRAHQFLTREKSAAKEAGGLGRHVRNRVSQVVSDIGSEAEASSIGRLSPREFGALHRVVSPEIDVVVSDADIVLSRAILGKITDEEQLFTLARSFDPTAAKEIAGIDNAAARIQRYQQLLSNRMRIRRSDVFKEESIDITTHVKEKRTKSAQFDAAKAKIRKYLQRDLTDSNIYIGDTERSMPKRRRSIRREVRANIGGLDQIIDYKQGAEGRRVFHMLAGYPMHQVVQDATHVNEMGDIEKVGVLNTWGMNTESFAKFEELMGDEWDYTYGFDIERMRRPELITRTTEILRPGGEAKSNHIINLVTTLNNKERRMMDSWSKTAHHRYLSLDIETGFGKARALGSLSEMNDAGLDTSRTFMSGVLDLMDVETQRLHSDFVNAVAEGDYKSAARLMNELRDEKHGAIWITQASGTEFIERSGRKSAEYSQFSINEEGSFDLGKKNVGRSGGRYLRDTEFEELIDRLTEEAEIQRKTGSTILGIEVDKFDMRVIRSQAWRLGQYYYAKEQIIDDYIQRGSPAKKQELAHIFGIDLTNLADEQFNQRLSEERSTASRLSAKFLGYSGEAVIEDGKVVGYIQDATADRLTPINILTHARRFLHDIGLTPDDRVTDEVIERINLRIKGELDPDTGKRTGHIVIDGGRRYEGKPSSARSQQVMHFGEAGDDIQSRVRTMTKNLSRAELEQLTTEILDKEFSTERKRARDKIHKWYETIDIDATLRIEYDPRVDDMIDEISDLWAEKKVEEAIGTIRSRPFSQESILYTRARVWTQMIGNSVTNALRYAGTPLIEMVEHGSFRDTIVATPLLLGEIFSTATQKASRMTMHTIQNPGDELVDAVNATPGMTIPFMGYDEPNNRGVRGMAYYIGGVAHKTEQLPEEVIANIYRLSERVTDKAASATTFATKISENIAQDVSAEILRNFGVTIDIESMARGYRRAAGIGAGIALAATALSAGSKYLENRKEDEVWRYGDTESDYDIEQRTKNYDATMGKMVLDMWDRRNYSYNMRNDKYDHLFRRW